MRSSQNLSVVKPFFDEVFISKETKGGKQVSTAQVANSKHLFPLCSRWIRLLYGREFSIPRLLTLWDGLFADGISLDLVDYIYLAMLINLRGVCK